MPRGPPRREIGDRACVTLAAHALDGLLGLEVEHPVPRPPAHLGMAQASIPYRLTCVLLGDEDGEAAPARLRALAASEAAWSAGDLLDLALLPDDTPDGDYRGSRPPGAGVGPSERRR